MRRRSKSLQSCRAPRGLGRRDWLKTFGLGSAAAVVFSRALVSLADESGKVTEAQIRQAEWVAGVEFTDEQRALMLEGVQQTADGYAALRSVPLDNGVAPAIQFVPELLPTARASGEETSSSPAVPTERAASVKPDNAADLAFLPVSELSALLRTRQVTSTELTQTYLDRLRTFDPQLECVITLTEEMAMAQAKKADREIAAGLYRGPLHGVPWGAKDLLAVPGYPTTWGAGPFKEQQRPEKATVVARLEAAGAVLTAKLTLGALAWGDVWYGGTTKNPWNTEQGSSGSSAGSASATAAGLVGFAIGSETWGSIVSPSTRCGTSGLRPSFGRISRHGAMALSWTMDKLGPIARSIEDCALVFSAIHGHDGLDPTAVDRPFAWPPKADPRTLRVGVVRSMFEADRTEGVEDEKQKKDAAEWMQHDLRTLDTLEKMGMQLVDIEMPEDLPSRPLGIILTAEAACAFDDMTRDGRVNDLKRQSADAWPNVFRQGQLIPAVEYIRANRIRRLWMQRLAEIFQKVDVYVTPSFGGDNLLITNLTGHPQTVLPNGFRSSDGTPTSITFTGRLHGDADLLAVSHAYQQATTFHLARPELESEPS